MTDPLKYEVRALLDGAWTVADLRAALVDVPDDAYVIVHGEHGQGGESPACGVERVWYRPESTWGGEVSTHPEDDDEPDPAIEVRAIFIEPVN